MNIFKFINLPVFLVAFVLGVLFVYLVEPQTKKVFVYPTSETWDKIQYKDAVGNCFGFQQTEVECPKDKSLIAEIPPQTPA
jgi:hypothetical protein